MEKVNFKQYKVGVFNIVIVLIRNISINESYAKIGVGFFKQKINVTVLNAKKNGANFPVEVARIICLGSEKMTMDTVEMSQSKIVMAHFKRFGQITSLESTIHYDITRLSSIIHELRRKGEIITSVKQTSVRGENYVKYFYQSK